MKCRAYTLPGEGIIHMLSEYEINLALRLRPQGFEDMRFDDEDYTRCFLACFNESKKSILTIGEAGSGKTRIMKAVAAHYGAGALVLTLTGMGAQTLNDDRTRAMTIHAGLGLPARPYYNETDIFRRPIEALRGIDVVLLDEVSLVNANLLDTIIRHINVANENRRRKIRLLAFGDPFQASPVFKETELEPVLRDHPNLRNCWAFTRSRMFERMEPELHVLRKVYRQKDPEFRAVLGRIREGKATESDMKYLNAHVSDTPNKHSLVLATTLREVRNINGEHLDQLLRSQKPVNYDARFELGNKISDSGFEPHLELCKGERVMCTRNHYSPDGDPIFCNGKLGTIIDFRVEDGSLLPVVRADSGEVFVVPYVDYEECELRKNEEGKYDYVPKAKAFMIPLAASWAITYHKAQGQTLDDVHLQIPDRCPQEGLMYMGLSRTRSIKGLTLSKEVTRDMFIVPEFAKAFLKPAELTR